MSASSTSNTTQAASGLRRWLLVLHRWVGLSIAVFIIVAGLTGTLLVFNHELDAALNPQLFRVDANAKALDPFELRERAQANLGGAQLHEVNLNPKPGESVVAWTDDREYFIHPADGSVLGSRKWGDITEGLRLNAMPFIYRLHYSLGLGDVGIWLFGIAALLWTLDCFVGAYLTFPAQSSSPRPWLSRWGSAWLMKTGQLFGSIFTFHRAAGLWLWAMLFVFAWSGVGFNLNPVFQPVMGLIGYEDAWYSLPQRETPLTQPKLDFHAAHAAAKPLMQAEARRLGFDIKREGAVEFDPERGVYRYSVHSSFDLGDRWPETSLWLDADTGKQLALDLSTGQNAGNTLAHWLFALHMGIVGGWPYRIVVAILGVLISLLAVSGVWIWWRKRRALVTATYRQQTAALSCIASTPPQKRIEA
jgi:uncharacterized iron-regulated membrane protein